MSTLGEQLAHNTAKLQVQDTAFMEQQAERKGPEAFQNFRLVKDFFHDVREELSEQIERGETKISIELGNDGSRAQHTEVETLLLNGRYAVDCMKTLASETHPYHCLWRDFSAWAQSNELVVAVADRHDGGGMRSWLALTCQPDPALLRNRQSYPRG